DVLQMLGQLILSQTLPACTVERFTTNAECLAGVEKLAVSATKPELLTGPVTPVTVKDFAPDEAGSVGPMEIFYVKGWSRSVPAVACLLHAYELPDALEVWEDELMNTEVLQLLLMRLEKDYATLHVKARKPYEAMQRVCCLYLACERSLRSKVPEAFFLEQQPEIRKS
ncbi:unnamed protein product, partial [Durusdinium trenchii]